MMLSMASRPSVAEKKAEANRALNDSLNSNLLEYYKITDVESRWNGELPAYVGDGNSIPIINGKISGLFLQGQRIFYSMG